MTDPNADPSPHDPDDPVEHFRRRRPPETRARPVRSHTIHAHANEHNDAVLPILGQENWGFTELFLESAPNSRIRPRSR